MRSYQRQHGVTLVVGLIMLILLTIIVLSAVSDSNSNLRVAGNMQAQSESVAAAQQAIEQILSNNFTAAPVATEIDVDINGDSTMDYTVLVAQPTCESSTPLTNATPNLPAECLSSSSMQNTGIVNSSGGSTSAAQSWCYAQLWEIQAQATSNIGTGATSTVHQGASLNVPVGTGC